MSGKKKPTSGITPGYGRTYPLSEDAQTPAVQFHRLQSGVVVMFGGRIDRLGCFIPDPAKFKQRRPRC